MRALAIFVLVGLGGIWACTTPPQPQAVVRDETPDRLPARPTTPVTVTALRSVPATLAEAPGSYADWSAMVIAGDNRANNGEITQAFDNARREVARRLVSWGFDPEDLRQYSTQADSFPDEAVNRTSMPRFSRELANLKMGTGGGCLFYITSHGTRAGVTFGENILSPEDFWDAVDRLCGRQPVITIISACHSGVFADSPWQKANRFILTAARADRTSFGCGIDNVYPYFDECFLKNAEGASSWPALAEGTRACVARREAAADLTPSEPQLFIGEEIGAAMAMWRLGGETAI